MKKIITQINIKIKIIFIFCIALLFFSCDNEPNHQQKKNVYEFLNFDYYSFVKKGNLPNNLWYEVLNVGFELADSIYIDSILFLTNCNFPDNLEVFDTITWEFSHLTNFNEVNSNNKEKYFSSDRNNFNNSTDIQSFIVLSKPLFSENYNYTLIKEIRIICINPYNDCSITKYHLFSWNEELNRYIISTTFTVNLFKEYTINSLENMKKKESSR